MTIEITNESGVDVDETVLLRLTEHNLAELHVSADADIAILLVDEGAMEALHVQWMDEPGPTDAVTANISSRSFCRAYPTAMCTIACSLRPW